MNDRITLTEDHLYEGSKWSVLGALEAVAWHAEWCWQHGKGIDARVPDGFAASVMDAWVDRRISDL